MLAPVSHFASSQAIDTAGWKASLSLDFARRGDCTDLRFRHEGPLRIQKPLYPDGPQSCHAVVVHPPGGIASGDHLRMDISVATDSHALITTPSAAKWYGSLDLNKAKQEIEIKVDGSLEWLPCETIVFDKAHVASEITIGLGHDARMLGWDLLIFGRHGSGERFVTGLFEQTLKLALQEQVVWIDRLRLTGSDPLFDSPIGLGGRHALATCWAVTPDKDPWTDCHIEVIRSICPAIAWTCLHPRLLVGRQVGCPIQMQERLQHAWRFLKQTYWGLAAPSLRLWAT